MQHIYIYDHFCNDLSLDSEFNHLKTLFLLFQKNVDIRTAYERIYEPCPFLDWEQEENMKTYRGYKDTSVWIRFSQYFVMGINDLTWKTFVQQHKIFSHYLHSLQFAKLDLNPLQCAQLFLLLNIINLQAMNVIQQYFSILFDKDVHKEALIFFCQQANIPFDKEDRTKAVVALLSECLEVDYVTFQSEVELEKSREGKLSQVFRQKHMQASSLRPRLRSKIKQDAIQMSALATLDNFKPWCDTIRFPNVYSMSHKKKLYFTMSQSAVNFNDYIEKFVSEKEISQVILQYQVKNPDIDILTDTIMQTRIISEPFPELHLFRNQCFHCFSVQQKAMLRLNDLLHLYIAAYQPMTVWKAVWKSIVPILSIQIIKDVEAFVQANEINHSAIMHIIFAKNSDLT